MGCDELHRVRSARLDSSMLLPWGWITLDIVAHCDRSHCHYLPKIFCTSLWKLESGSSHIKPIHGGEFKLHSSSGHLRRSLHSLPSSGALFATSQTSKDFMQCFVLSPNLIHLAASGYRGDQDKDHGYCPNVQPISRWGRGVVRIEFNYLFNISFRAFIYD